ncbi:uncharacterized protein LOC127862004 isoform X2 [Dreissena polymorpha]|uniref:uncharacterized protein LOC127862004 isoform X2 n=1 Tax=Dreissena polymorpha TaxID=45954 RepID=UPI00226430AE|nr:uncharacterized protein LOC127862004 isoform X2 [Dreissena polymorpha]
MGIYGWDEPQINIYLTFEHLIFELKHYNIIKMELVQVANTLRHQLIALDNSEHNKAEIDHMLKLLGASYFKAEMLDNQFQQLHLALRLSVTEGVQQMFQTYITNKEMQVQNTAETIKSSLEDGQTPVMTSLMTSPPTSSSVGRTRPDRSTTVWVNMDIETYRSS